MTSQPTVRPRRALVTVALSLALGLGLAACTAGDDRDGGSTDGGEATQSVEQACTIVSEEVQTAVAGFEEAAQDDPEVAAETLRSAADGLEQASARITNAEVSAILPELQDLFGRLGEVVEDVLVDGDISQADALQTIATDFQGTLGEFQSLCAPTEE